MRPAALRSTIVSRQSAFVTSNQNVRSAVEQARAAASARSQSARRFQAYCSAPAQAQRRRPARRRAARAATASRPARQQQEQRIGRARAESSTGGCRSRSRRRRRTARAGRASVAASHRSSEQQRQRDEEHVQRVDLGDDRLAPERVRRRRRAAPPPRRPATEPDSSTPTSTMRPQATRASHRRREVQRVRADRRRRSRRRARADREVERIAVARRDERAMPPSPGTTACRRDRGRAAASRGTERTRRWPTSDGGQQSASAARTAVSRLRVCAAMSARISASGRVFRTCRGSTQPRRAVMTPSSICRPSSFGAVAVAVDRQQWRRRRSARRASAPSRSRCAGRAVDFDDRAASRRPRRTAGRSRARSPAGAARAGWSDA